MNLDDFMITCFCMIDEMVSMIIKGQRLGARGPAPKLSESEAITMEVVGSYLGLSQDKALFDYFQRHYTHFSPALKDQHRATGKETGETVRAGTLEEHAPTALGSLMTRKTFSFSQSLVMHEACLNLFLHRYNRCRRQAFFGEP